MIRRDHYDWSREAIVPAHFESLHVLNLPPGFRLSVVIPTYNEVRTIGEVISRVRSTGLPCEIIIVDDGSTDGTRELLAQFSNESDVRVLLHERNQGKGAALKTGFLKASGDAVVVQDADLEYDPADFERLLEPILSGNADVVFGSRYLEPTGHVPPYRLHTLANRTVTIASNLFSGLRLTDMETCYKLFRREVIAQIAPTLRETGFGIEPELTAKVARLKGTRIVEVPIRYAARGYEEGKKIGWRDGIWAIWCAMRY